MMPIHFYIQEAFRQLFCFKLRGFLAVLGILVGTASVVAMMSIGELAEQQILDQFEKMGINLLSVNIIPQHMGQNSSHSTLSLPAAQNTTSASSNITRVAPYISNYGNIKFDGYSFQGSSVGTTPEIFDIAKLSLTRGRYLSFLDANHYYAVIGYKLASQMQHKSGKLTMLGQQITIGNDVYTVVGILAKWPTNFFFQTNFNSAALIPITTAINSQKEAAISNLAVKINNTQQLTATKHALTQYIKAHTYQQRVQIQNPKSLIDSMKKSSQTMTLLLAFIGSISLIVGGIGVMNIMLVSVTERKKEIGIRMAIGARQRDIQWQFLIESTALSISGGMIGMILGILITFGVSLYSHWQFHFFSGPPLIGCLVSVLVGVFFGYYPARKASKLDPIQTLRSD